MALVDLLIEVQPQHISQASQRHTRLQLLTLRRGILLEIPLQLIQPRIILAGTLLDQRHTQPRLHITQISQRHTQPRLLIQPCLQRHNQLEHRGPLLGLLHIIQVC